MSYVLNIWEQPTGQALPNDIREVPKLVGALYSQRSGVNPRFVALARTLTQRFPLFDEMPVDDGEDEPDFDKCAWSDGSMDGYTTNAVLNIGLNTGMLAEVQPFVVAVATQLGLSVLDQQAGVAYFPGGHVLSVPQAQPAPMPKEAERNPMAASSKAFVERAIAAVKSAEAPVSGLAGVSLPEAEMPVVKLLGNGLCVVYLVDTDLGLEHVQQRHIAEAGITPEQLHDIGVANLTTIPDHSWRFTEYAGFYGLEFGGLFETSAILYGPLWDTMLTGCAPNGYVVALPARGIFAFCDAQSEEGLANMRGLVEKVFSAGRSHLISRQLFRRESRQWVPLE